MKRFGKRGEIKRTFNNIRSFLFAMWELPFCCCVAWRQSWKFLGWMSPVSMLPSCLECYHGYWYMGDIPLCHASSSTTEETPLFIIKKKVKIVWSAQWSSDHSKKFMERYRWRGPKDTLLLYSRESFQNQCLFYRKSSRWGTWVRSPGGRGIENSFHKPKLCPRKAERITSSSRQE